MDDLLVAALAQNPPVPGLGHGRPSTDDPLRVSGNYSLSPLASGLIGFATGQPFQAQSWWSWKVETPASTS